MKSELGEKIDKLQKLFHQFVAEHNKLVESLRAEIKLKDEHIAVLQDMAGVEHISTLKN